jgi:hypothetical protein
MEWEVEWEVEWEMVNTEGELVTNTEGGLVTNTEGGLVTNTKGGLVTNTKGGLVTRRVGGTKGLRRMWQLANPKKRWGERCSNATETKRKIASMTKSMSTNTSMNTSTSTNAGTSLCMINSRQLAAHSSSAPAALSSPDLHGGRPCSPSSVYLILCTLPR